MMRNFFLKIAILVFSLSVTCCGGGGGGSSADKTGGPAAGPESSSVTLSGIVAKGIVRNGTVHIYAISGDGRKDKLLATVSTDNNGAYTAAIGDYAGPVLIEATGSYTDEATGSQKTIPPESPMRAAVTASGNTAASVTPLTELAVLIAGPALTPDAILAANALVTNVFGFNVLLTRPVEITTTALHEAQPDQRRYALALAAISHMAHEEGTPVSGLLAKMKNDVTIHHDLSDMKALYSAAEHTFLSNHPEMADMITQPHMTLNAKNGTILIRDDGELWACGAAATFVRLAPELSGFIAAEKGTDRIYAVRRDGTVWTISYGGAVSRLNITDVASIATTFGGGFYFSQNYALKHDGSVWALNPELVQVAGLSGILSIAGGYSHVAALKHDGTVWTWGSNRFGQLGDGTTSDRDTAAQVSGLSGVTALAAGGDDGSGSFTLALKSDGTVWGWGQNVHGQLGDGTNARRLSPVKAKGLSGIIAIAAGRQTSYAITHDGTVWSTDISYLAPGAWNDTPYTFQPSGISGLHGMIAISSGIRGVTFATKSDGSVWSWGINNEGQLGNGQGNGFFMPVDQNLLTVALSGNSAGSVSLPSNGGFTLAVDGIASRESTLFVPARLIKIIAVTDANSTVAWAGCDSVSGNQCSVNMVSAKRIDARILIKEFTITADSLGNGTITPKNAVVKYGESITFTITPDQEYELKRLSDNGVEKTAEVVRDENAGVYTYQLSGITTDHSIEVEFAKIEETP